MLKKIALLIMLILPMGVSAQTLKFGHINSAEIIPNMPEFTKASTDLKALEKKYTDDLQRSQEEFTRKYQEFQEALAKDSLPQNIAERRQKELADMAERQQQAQQMAQHDMQKAEQEMMTPIYKKLDDAIKAVGTAEGVVYIFDLYRTQIPFIGAQSIELTGKVKAQLGMK